MGSLKLFLCYKVNLIAYNTLKIRRNNLLLLFSIFILFIQRQWKRGIQPPKHSWFMHDNDCQIQWQKDDYTGSDTVQAPSLSISVVHEKMRSESRPGRRERRSSLLYTWVGRWSPSSKGTLETYVYIKFKDSDTGKKTKPWPKLSEGEELKTLHARYEWSRSLRQVEAIEQQEEEFHKAKERERAHGSWCFATVRTDDPVCLIPLALGSLFRLQIWWNRFWMDYDFDEQFGCNMTKRILSY